MAGSPGWGRWESGTARGWYSDGHIRIWIKEIEDWIDVQKNMTPVLDAVLAEMFAETQAVVHVITGRLKMSGFATSDWTGKATWIGEITYGGRKELGDIAYYGIYEWARGGTHDFYATLPWYEEHLRTAILEAL